MILTGSKIKEKVLAKEIAIHPFSNDQVNPNSYNFRLGKTLKIYQDTTLDSRKDNLTTTIEIPEDGYVMLPHLIYLGHTEEVMGSNFYVPIIRGRSSIGRIGIFINITSDLIDIGSINQWTLQMHCVQPVKVYPGMLIGQVTFWKVEGQIQHYQGKYKDSRGPISSKLFEEFSIPVDANLQKKTAYNE